MTLACLDGTVVPVAEAVVPATDDGLLRGDGVFEVVRIYANRPFALDAHLERMDRSARCLRLPCDVEAVRADIHVLLEAEQPGDALVRAVVTRGGHRLALVEALPDLGASMSLGYVVYAPTRVLDQVKSLSYAANMQAGRLARERGFDEALLVTPHGRVLEAPTASLFWVAEGRLHTPPLSDHLLDSITRRLVIETMDATETVTTREDLQEADEAFLASTVREVLAVARIEDHALPIDGPVTAEAARRVRARIEAMLGQTISG
ncbi:MAG TPA: aminotransferase class IV [Solirubrobacteraceae bacterium]|jgi:branched-chain amino acid aminotransferase|nr:aminotransferase class IV [Solirubrobacteraceae bacterium]